MICWLTTLKRLPTVDKLARWNIINSSTCSLCNQDCEAEDPLWFSCDFVRGVAYHIWNWVGVGFRMTEIEDCWNWFQKEKSRKNNIFQSKLLAFTAIIYYTWWARNEVIFNRITPKKEDCIRRIKDECKLRIIVRLKLTGRREMAMRRRLQL